MGSGGIPSNNRHYQSRHWKVVLCSSHGLYNTGNGSSLGLPVLINKLSIQVIEPVIRGSYKEILTSSHKFKDER